MNEAACTSAALFLRKIRLSCSSLKGLQACDFYTGFFSLLLLNKYHIMKIVYPILAGIILFSSCNQSGKTEEAPANDTAAVTTTALVEKTDSLIVTAPSDEKQVKIIDMLKKLPECRRTDKYLDSLTGHQQSLAFMIFNPEKGEKDYYVKAGFSGKERFETYYNFYVDSATMAIRIDDVVNGDLISMEEWRRREKARK